MVETFYRHNLCKIQQDKTMPKTSSLYADMVDVDIPDMPIFQTYISISILKTLNKKGTTVKKNWQEVKKNWQIQKN